MARKTRKAARKASSSMMMLLIISAAILAFIPFQVTLATGSSGAATFCSYLATTIGTSITGPNACAFLMALGGTHIAIDALGILLNASFVNSISNVFPGALANGFLGLKAQKVTVDLTYANNTAISGLFGPYGTNPTAGALAGANTIEIRLVMLSVTITGYEVPKTGTTPYGEINLQGLNAALMISLDRAFIDLFIDPYHNVAVYAVSADMTVYQGLALVLQAASL